MSDLNVGDTVETAVEVSLWGGTHDVLFPAGTRGRVVERVADPGIFDYDVRFEDGTVLSFYREELLHV